MIILTIDGPTASGKSSAAHLLAQKLGFYHLSSGFLFRALAYLLLTKAGYTLESLACPGRLDTVTYLDPERFVVHFNESGSIIIFFDNHDITPLLKTTLIDQGSSILGLDARVREALCQVQRALAERYNLVVDGRDAGSVIFPHAQVKFFLTAHSGARAQRWLEEQQKKGVSMTLAQAQEQIMVRDKRDSQRAIAPLCVPEGAFIIDSTVLGIEAVVASMVQEVTFSGSVEQKRGNYEKLPL